MRTSTSFALLSVLAFATVAGAQGAPHLILDAKDGGGIRRPSDVELAADGTLYVACSLTDNVLRVAPDGATDLLLRTSGDGLEQPLDDPQDLLLDSQGRLYVAGAGSDNVFRLDPDGTLTVVLDKTGSGTGVVVNGPGSMAKDSADNVIVADQSRVFRIAPDGTASLLLDTSGPPDATTPLGVPRVVPGEGGDVYVLGNTNIFGGGVDSVIRIPDGGVPTELFTALDMNPVVLRFASDGDLVVAGASGELYRIEPDGTGTLLLSALLNGQVWLEVTQDDRIFIGGRQTVQSQNFGLLLEVTGPGAFQVLPIISTGGIQYLALDDADDLFFQNGSGLIKRWSGGQITSFLDVSGSALGSIEGLAWMPDGRFVLSQDRGVVSVAPDASTEVVVDSTANGLEFDFDGVGDMLVTPEGDVYVSGELSDTVLRIDGVTGAVETLLDATGGGTGQVFERPADLLLAPDGAIFVAGEFSNNVFRIEPDGTASVVLDATGAGPGNPFISAGNIALDSQGNLYASGNLSQILRVSPAGVVTDISEVLSAFAPTATHGLAVDASDNLYVSDIQGDRVFRVTQQGVVTLMIDSTGDGAGHPMQNCQRIRIGPDGALYVVDLITYTVFRVSQAGAISVLIDAAGDGVNPLTAVRDVAFDGYGSAYVCARATSNAFRIAKTPNQIEQVYQAEFNPAVQPFLEWIHGVGTDAQDRFYLGGDKSDNIWRFDGPPTWPDLGGGVPGAAGTPELVVRAPLTAGSVLDRRLENLPPSTLLLNWIATSSTPFPFLGGTVHAFPFVAQLYFVSDVDGRAVLSITWPAGMPSGVDLYLQFLVDDPSVPGGIGLSNAVLSTTP